MGYPDLAMPTPAPASLAHLRALRYRLPDVPSALAETAHLSAILTLPRGTIHVVSDVHGEFQKLEHVLRNGSGSLRPLVDRVFGERLDEAARATLLNLVYYPRETWQRVTAGLADPAAGGAFVRDTILRELELVRVLMARYGLRHARRIFPPALTGVLDELLFSPLLARDPAYVDALLAPFIRDDGGVEILRATAHVLRSFSSYEIIVAGDLGDRGPRLDRVIDALRRQRNLAITWGNHDAEWMGACLGQEALIATVMRISLRYGRLSQLEEGYGIPVEPLEQLVHASYANDPAERFHSKGEDLRDPLLLARMQKAAAILQFKLEGQTSRRNPQFDIESRSLLHRIDPNAGTVTIDGNVHPLLDKTFPTIDWADPYKLSEAEARCMELLKRSFLGSAALWRDMGFVADRGGMVAVRDENLIFHGCVPCDDKGELLELEVDGAPRKGRALFDALDRVVRRAFKSRAPADVDVLYYLWAGPRSPLFGKDRMATFETYFVADKASHKETKNAYFQLIHEAPFCRRIAREMGVDSENVLIVNGHVPVKLEAGESPLKKSGLAVTIDGAFSEAYGDHGFTLVIDAEQTYLAKHHHFESIEGAIERGADIVPEIQVLRQHLQPIRVGDTQRGDELREEISALEQLVVAYRDRLIEPPST
jgi:fructose-1,6-bisphosphatase-3